MRKILSLIFLFAGINVYAQTFQDAEGESSILMPFGSVTLNTKAANLGISYYYGIPTLGVKTDFTDDRQTNQFLSGADSANIAGRRFIIGLKASGESKTGLVNIFKEGRFTPQSTIGGIIGLRGFMRAENLFKRYKELKETLKTIKENKDLNDNNKDENQRDFTNLINALKLYKDTITDSTGLSDEEKIPIRAEYLFIDNLLKEYNHVDKVKANDPAFRSRITAWCTKLNNTSLTGARNNVKNQIVNVLNDIITRNAVCDNIENNNRDLQANRRNLNSTIDDNNNSTYRLFFSVEKTRSSFKLYDPAKVILSQKYIDTTFEGYAAKINLNITIKEKNIIGFSYGKSLVNNVSSLSPVTLTTETTFVDSNRTDKITDNISALKGTYITYTTVPLQMDYIRFFKLEKNMLALNAYWRSYFNESGEGLPKTTHNTGIGAYFFNPENSKFLGGVFLELPDIENTAEKDRESSNNRKFYQRLSFGIVAKFNFIKYDFSDVLPGY